MVKHHTMYPLELISLHSKPEINRVSEFSKVAENLEIQAIAGAYLDLLNNAPKRAHSRKSYFQTGHDGYPSGEDSSNRREEHLALALFNQASPLHFPDGKHLNIIDYQTPLKASRNDKGVGKIDLFGVLDSTIPAVIELKINGINGGMADTPLRALLEGLAYCAIIEANMTDIADEASSIFNLKFIKTKPDLIVMAPNDYWQSYINKSSAGNWLQVFEELISGIRQTLQINTYLVSLSNAEFEMGSSKKKPKLLNHCHASLVKLENGS